MKIDKNAVYAFREGYWCGLCECDLPQRSIRHPLVRRYFLNTVRVCKECFNGGGW